MWEFWQNSPEKNLFKFNNKFGQIFINSKVFKLGQLTATYFCGIPKQKENLPHMHWFYVKLNLRTWIWCIYVYSWHNVSSGLPTKNESPETTVGN